MELSLASAIKQYGADELATASGIKRRTLYRWASEGIPGDGPAQDWRINHLRAVVESAFGAVIALTPKPKRKRKASSKKRRASA